MPNTKENILMTALHLFARDGYEAVSVSMIAGELGITKGALYKHYSCKHDIFDCIVERMYEVDHQRSREYGVPEETYGSGPLSYKHVSIDRIQKFTISQFVFWTEDTFASDFRRMLTLEQYRSAEMAELYQKCITAGPVEYTEDIFREMIREGVLKDEDPKQLAVTFCAPLFLLITISDGKKSKEEYVRLLQRHMEYFFACSTAQKEQERT